MRSSADKDRAGLHMGFNSHDRVSHLFLVRIRAEDAAADQQPETQLWCGRVQHVVSGEACGFSGWRQLVECLRVMLADTQARNDDGA